MGIKKSRRSCISPASTIVLVSHDTTIRTMGVNHPHSYGKDLSMSYADGSATHTHDMLYIYTAIHLEHGSVPQMKWGNVN